MQTEVSVFFIMFIMRTWLVVVTSPLLPRPPQTTTISPKSSSLPTTTIIQGPTVDYACYISANIFVPCPGLSNKTQGCWVCQHFHMSNMFKIMISPYWGCTVCIDVMIGQIQEHQQSADVPRSALPLWCQYTNYCLLMCLDLPYH